MPSWEGSSFGSDRPIKMLVLGDSGSGKTGACAQLVNELGLRLVIADYDNGLDILRSLIDKDKRHLVFSETLTDKMRGGPKGAIPDGTPTAFTRAMRLHTHWKTADYDLGNPKNWGVETVLLEDSATFLGNAILRFEKNINGADLESDWGYIGGAMARQEKFFEMLYDDAMKCNIIVTAHLYELGGTKNVLDKDGKLVQVDTGEGKLYPSALGKKLPPKVGRFFNTVVRCETVAAGTKVRRIIRTQSEKNLELKTPCPEQIPRELPLETGFATIFKTIREQWG